MKTKIQFDPDEELMIQYNCGCEYWFKVYPDESDIKRYGEEDPPFSWWICKKHQDIIQNKHKIYYKD